MNGTAWMALMLFFVAAGHGVYAVMTGTVYFRGQQGASRAEQPVMFWLSVAGTMAVALISLLVVFLSDRIERRF